jgi:hypothetical protein
MHHTHRFGFVGKLHVHTHTYSAYILYTLSYIEVGGSHTCTQTYTDTYYVYAHKHTCPPSWSRFYTVIRVANKFADHTLHRHTHRHCTNNQYTHVWVARVRYAMAGCLYVHTHTHRYQSLQHMYTHNSN